MPSTVLTLAETAVAPWRDVDVVLPAAFRLESGERLAKPFIRVRIHGRDAAPLIIALGGISAGREVCDTEMLQGWWGELAGPGRVIDTDRHAVLGFDFLPNDGETAKTISVNDQARALAFALEYLGLGPVHTFIGSSFGGMIGLAFAAIFPNRIENLCAISAAHRAHPMTTALRGVQRRAIQFGIDKGDPAGGVALAREIAMTTYRSVEEFGARFESDRIPDAAGGAYPVCEYLTARGKAYAQVMDPQRYITLSDSLDRHNVNPQSIRTRTFLIAAQGDRVVPQSDMEELAAQCPEALGLACLPTKFGHDAFLLETQGLSVLLTDFLQGDSQ